MKTVLLIDDDDALLMVFAAALQHAGYHVLTAPDGPAGLEMARRNLPDLVLCDINMPGMEGTAVLRALREDPELAETQFVLMTGNLAGVTPRRGMQMGADDFLVKPFTIQELLGCVEARLRRAEVHWRIGDRVVTDLRTSLRSTLPHEFFTPLAGMLGLVEVLRGDLGTLPTSDVADILAEIDRSGWRLHRTLKNYLFVLDLEAETKAGATPARALAPDEVRVSIETGIEAAMKRQKRRDDLTTRIEPGPLAVSPHDLSVIVEELLDNACSFSRRGTPIELTLAPDGRLTVTDHGRGMTPEQIQQIGAFQQFDRKKYEQQGLGLGLVIVSKLATRHGGSLQLESEPGTGTTARVTLTSA